MKKLYLLVICLFPALCSYGQWMPQAGDTDFNLTNLFLLDENTGWVYGGYLNTQQSTIFKTTNGGVTWDSISGFNNFGLFEMIFIDSLNGWGELSWAPENDGIYRTMDGGETWELHSDEMHSIDFVDENVGFVLGSSEPYPLYRTNDGGNSWFVVDTMKTGVFECGTGDLDFINDSIGFISVYYSFPPGAGGFQIGMRKTTDGGMSWEGGDHPHGFGKLFFIDEAIGYNQIVSGINGGGVIGLHKSVDGAETWDQVNNDYINSMFFTAPDKGWISVSGCIRCTRDGGMNWQQQYEGNGFINDIFFVDDLNGWAVGQSGLILHTVNGGGLFTSTQILHYGIETIKLCPNPVYNISTLDFELFERAMVSVEIVSITGERTVLMVDQLLSSGKHKLNLHMSDLPTGIYICTVHLGGMSRSIKLIKV